MRMINAVTRRGIVFEQSEAAIDGAVIEYCETRRCLPEVIISPLPIISTNGNNIDKVGGIPVSVCPGVPAIIVTDTRNFCEIMQYEKEAGLLNEH
jgi:hypothetical protein